MNKIKIEVDIDEILEMKAKLRFINHKAFDQIIWMRNGSAIEFSQCEKDEFKYTGLNNTDFIDFYLDSGQHLED